ncbi:MAG: BON domain-containing protein [Fimbriimonadaceae bacterium]
MKNTLYLVIALVLAVGCGQKAAENTQNAAEGASTTASNLEAAAMLTPKVKLAISADKQLNDPTNMINVNSSEEMVTLEGHVTSAILKEQAGSIASKVLTENNAKQSLDNKLEIKP